MPPRGWLVSWFWVFDVVIDAFVDGEVVLRCELPRNDFQVRPRSAKKGKEILKGDGLMTVKHILPCG